MRDELFDTVIYIGNIILYLSEYRSYIEREYSAIPEITPAPYIVSGSLHTGFFREASTFVGFVLTPHPHPAAEPDVTVARLRPVGPDTVCHEIPLFGKPLPVLQRADKSVPGCDQMICRHDMHDAATEFLSQDHSGKTDGRCSIAPDRFHRDVLPPDVFLGQCFQFLRYYQ